MKALQDKYGDLHAMPGPYRRTEEVMTANRALGQNYFSPDTMRFFRSRVAPGVTAGRLFITSEQPPSGEREYTVRCATDDGHVVTVGEFGEYPNLRAARRAVARIVASLSE